MASPRTLACALARAFLAGPLTETSMLARGQLLLGRKPRWLKGLIRQILEGMPPGIRPKEAELASYLRLCSSFERAFRKGNSFPIKGDRLTSTLPVMAPAEGAPQRWDVPDITDYASLADLLQLDLSQLLWLLHPGENGKHYHCHWIAKRSGGRRLLESPKPLLKRTQRYLLQRILPHIPVHSSSKGFVPGSSLLSYVQPHVSKPTVLHLDLANFFPSITRARILRLFLTVGYPESIAEALARLTTHRLLQKGQTLEFNQEETLLYGTAHLPQGAPTSPLLANLATFRLDCRLQGLAKATGLTYTRYADDLLFSGRIARQRAERFLTFVYPIILEEGFTPNWKKTRVMSAHQRQIAAGVILNQAPNLSRKDFDRLKATLHNCARHGLASQNHEQHPHFHQHLEGKVSWWEAIHPERGAKLRRLFRTISLP